MGRKPCCEKEGLKRGPWTKEEDKKLINFMLNHGQCAWRVVPKLAGLLRCGKSCRLRWTNYLRPDLRRGLLSEDEEKLVIELHSQFGNRWSKIASHLPGRTDNEIKNIWNTHIKKKLRKIGIDPLTHKSIIPPADELHHHHQNKQLQRRQQSEDEAAASSKCSSKVAEKEAKEKKDVTTPFDPAADADADASASLGSCPEFCTDEVPMMQPHEILIPCDSSASSAPCSSAKAEEIELAYMELQESVYLWGLDDLTGWDSIDEDEVWKYDLFLFDF